MIDLDSLSMYNMTDDKQTSASTNHNNIFLSLSTIPKIRLDYSSYPKNDLDSIRGSLD
jgi:hypothetical protein